MVLAFGRPRFCCLHFLGQYIWGIQARAGSAPCRLCCSVFSRRFPCNAPGRYGSRSDSMPPPTTLRPLSIRCRTAECWLAHIFSIPVWLTGGTVGPEGSVVDFGLLLVAFLVVALILPEKRIQPAGA